MPIEDKVVKYSAYVSHNDFVDLQRSIDLRLESGGMALIHFPKDPPNDWLQFNGSCTTIYYTWPKTSSRMTSASCKRRARSSSLR